MKFSTTGKLIFNFLLSTVLTSGIIFLQKPNLKTENQLIDSQTYQKLENAEKINVSFLKRMPAFGFENLIANWSFIKFLLYFGDGRAREYTGYSITPEYFEIIVENDPRFVKAYFYLSPANSLFAGKPEAGNALITKGLESISPEISEEAYFLWIYKAIDELLFLGDHEAARQSYEMAAQWADKIGDERSQAVAAKVRQTAQFLTTNPDSVGAQIGSWFMLLSNTRDDEIRKQAINKIQELGGEISISPEGIVRVNVPQKNIDKTS